MSFLGSNNSKLALVIGINYTGMDGELNGCINDTKKIINFLKVRCGYLDQNIILLTDETENKPTKQNIIKAIVNFVYRANTQKFKELWFSYSGHGTYTWNYGGDREADYKDEALVPLDYKTAGLILDDYLNQKLVRLLPKDAKLFSIIDACHSGTSLDLPFIYRTQSGIEEHGHEEDIVDVCKISGCRDNQTSADAYINKKYQGALTFTFIKTLEDFRYNMTPKQIISRMQNYIKQNGYSQIPTLAFSKKDTLDNLLIGNDPNFHPNINIYLEGDKWCADETKWNIFDIKNNKMLFSDYRRFFMANEKVNYKLNLKEGTYILIFSDTYGDGGVEGNIKFINSGITINTFNFNSGSRKTVEFTVKSFQDVNNFSVEKKEVKFDIACDYYGSQESKWNVIDSLERNIFNGDITFSESNERQKFNKEMSPGSYKIKLMDTYGDGGISGKIKIGENIILDFNWNNLDWTQNNGYLKYIDFKVE